MKIFSACLLTFLLLGSQRTNAALMNGGFEDPVVTPGTFQKFTPGQVIGGAWTVLGTPDANVHVTRTYGHPSAGTASVGHADVREGVCIRLKALAKRPADRYSTAGDLADLQANVESLLREHDDKSGGFLNGLSLISGDKTWAPITEQPGTHIGLYKLLEQIGEGGMGIVYVAEQTEPVRRRVALKIIKPGRDTKQVIARFEAERQALAMMDHPNIAKILDAGTVGEGTSSQELVTRDRPATGHRPLARGLTS